MDLRNPNLKHTHNTKNRLLTQALPQSSSEKPSTFRQPESSAPKKSLLSVRLLTGGLTEQSANFKVAAPSICTREGLRGLVGTGTVGSVSLVTSGLSNNRLSNSGLLKTGNTKLTSLTSDLTLTACHSHSVTSYTTLTKCDTRSSKLRNPNIRSNLTSSITTGGLLSPRTSSNLAGSGIQTRQLEQQIKRAKKRKSQPSAVEADTERKRPRYDLNWEQVLGPCEPPELEVMRVIESAAEETAQDDEISKIKRNFVNTVGASLLRAPNFKCLTDETRCSFVKMCSKMADLDPEFVLKVAIYTRRDLSIRTTANFLLAFSGYHNKCRPFLKKYFKQSVILPSDWIEVAEIYQTFEDKRIGFGSLPGALRKAMVEKFPDFDQYQLAKYNKEKKKPNSTEPNKTKKKKLNELPVSRVVPDEASDDEESIELKTFTLKQLIRQLHIPSPVEAVMCLIGKKYPETSELFYMSRLPGTFDETRAGKRMRLPIPETWETQISMFGNKAEIWQKLIDNKKLPFMAMLRNIRNMLKTGISEQHHQKILGKLTDEGSVVHSKQFPFRFFSAFQVLDDLETDYNKHQETVIELAQQTADKPPARFRISKKTANQRRKAQKDARIQKKIKSQLKYDVHMLNRYRKALDTSVQIATNYNIPPISGTTIILCNAGTSMFRPCTTAKGLGKPKQVVEIAILLALMCKKSCESSDLILFMDKMHKVMDLSQSGILANTASLVNLASSYNVTDGSASVPETILREYLIDRKHIDNIIVLSDGLRYDTPDGEKIESFLSHYRQLVNPRALFVSIDLSSNKTGVDMGLVSRHPNDVFLAGFSDQLLRYVAERGDSGQMTYIENIDYKYNLNSNNKSGKPNSQKAVEKKTADTSAALAPAALLKTPTWRVARVFISSTFLDMHGERDMLTRYVFPAVRNWARSRFVNIHDVDLRWGVSEHATQQHGSLKLCLEEVQRCDYFIGLLGERYGWRPSTYDDLPNKPEFDWIKRQPIGRSVTDLEICLALKTKYKENCFFFLRDPEFLMSIPAKYRRQFHTEDEEARCHMETLKEDDIQPSGAEVFLNYPAKWGGEVDGKPITAGLEILAKRVVDVLKTAITRDYPIEDVLRDELEETGDWQEQLIYAKRSQFCGRSKIVTELQRQIDNIPSGVVLVHGDVGTGKTSFMAKLAVELCPIFRHLVCTGYTDIVPILQRLCLGISICYDLPFTLSDDYHELVEKVSELLKAAASEVSEPMVILIDGVNYLDTTNNGHTACWLPSQIPQNVIFILSTVTESPAFTALRSRSDVTLYEVKVLDVLDKATIAREHLSQHGKELNEAPFNNQMKLLTGKRGANNPLYLILACEELRYYGVYEKLTGKIKELPPTLPKLLDYMLTCLEAELGRELIANAMSLLYCTPEGISVEDFGVVLSLYTCHPKPVDSAKTENLTEITEGERVPSLVVSQILFRIQVFLEDYEKTGVLKLMYHSVLEAIKKRYFQSPDVEIRSHSLISLYYLHIIESCPPNPMLIRYYKHVVHHLKCSSQLTLAGKILADLKFLYKKCGVGLVTSINADFGADLPTKSKLLQKKWLSILDETKLYSAFIYKNTHNLIRAPNQFLQLALNEPDDSPIYQSAAAILPTINISYFDWITKPQEANQLLATIEMPTVIGSTSISKDGRLLAMGGEDCKVHVYQTSTCQEEITLLGHAHIVSHVMFVDSYRLVSTSHDNTACLWDLGTGHRLAVMEKHTRRVSGCVASQRALVTSGWDGSIKLWTKEGRFKEELCRVASPINDMSLHPEEVNVAVACWDNSIKVYNIITSKRVAVLHGHKSSVRKVSYSSSGHFISSASLDGEVKLWSAINGSRMGTYEGHSLPVRSLCFSPAGDQLITASEDARVKVWSSQLGRCLAVWSGNSEFGSTFQVTAVSLNNRGNVLAAGTDTGLVLTFDTDNMEKALSRCVVCRDSMISSVCWSPNQDEVLCCVNNGVLAKVSGNACTEMVNMKGSTHFECVAASSSWSVAFTDRNSVVYLRPYSGTSSELLTNRTVHHGAVLSCSFNHNGHLLATCGNDAKLVIWNCELDTRSNWNSELSALHIVDRAHQDIITAISWSDNVDALVTGSNDQQVKLWNLKTLPEPKQTFVGHSSAVSSVAFRSGCILSTATDGVMKVWSPKGSEITTINAHSGPLNSCSLAFRTQKGDNSAVDLEPEDKGDNSQQSDWGAYMEYEDSTPAKTKKDRQVVKTDLMNSVVVALGTRGGQVQLWNPVQANEKDQYITASSALSVCTSIEGKAVSSHLDRSVRIWSLPISDVQFQQLHTVGQRSDYQQITAVAVSKDHNVVTGSFDGSITLWTVRREYPAKLHRLQLSSKAISGIANYQHKLAVSSEDGLIYMVDPSHSTLRIVGSPINLKEPVKCVYNVAGNDSELYIGTWNRSIYVWEKGSKRPFRLTEEKYRTSLSFNANLDYKPEVGYKEADFIEWSKKLWVTSMCAAEIPSEDPTEAGYFGFYGTDEGEMYIHVLAADSMSKVTCHNAAITVIASLGNRVVATASLDSTVKIWKVNPSDGSLKLLNSFVNAAPVTHMAYTLPCTLDAYGKDRKMYGLFIGDKLGHFNTLEIHVPVSTLQA